MGLSVGTTAQVEYSQIDLSAATHSIIASQLYAHKLNALFTYFV